MKSARVLIVDDDPGLLQALSEALQLRMQTLSVETADSAASALESLTRTEYDAVVADIKMPGIDGLELLARIRELRPETPTLLITGHGEHDLAIQALRGGAQDYVQKPIDRDYFVGSLRHAIERSQLSRKLARHKQTLERQARTLQKCLEDRTHQVRELYQREALARAEIERVAAELEAEHVRRDELVSMIAHDLATPLTTLRGYAELLARPNITPEVRDRARTVILSETGRMARLVDDLVGGTHDGVYTFTIRMAPSDLVQIAREQIEVAAARSTQHAFVLDAPERLEMTCDRERVAQVLANLLDNAIAYAPRGEIRVRLERKGQKAQVSVHDQGPGIPADSLDSIFQPGVRLTRRRAGARPSGGGLGLSIARDIVEAHGGRIWAESYPGDGAAISLVLPIARGQRSRPGTGRRGTRSSHPQAGTRIRVG